MPTHWEGTPRERSALDAYIKLWRAARGVEVRANRHLGAHGLSLSQFSVLEALYFLGPLSQRALADKILKTSGNLTMVIDNLEKALLVRRERSETDRRLIHVHLTDVGREKIAGMLPAHVAGIADVFSALTGEEQATLARLCKKLGLGVARESTSAPLESVSGT